MSWSLLWAVTPISLVALRSAVDIGKVRQQCRMMRDSLDPAIVKSDEDAHLRFIATPGF